MNNKKFKMNNKKSKINHKFKINNRVKVKVKNLNNNNLLIIKSCKNRIRIM